MLRGERKGIGFQCFRPRDAWRTVHKPDGEKFLEQGFSHLIVPQFQASQLGLGTQWTGKEGYQHPVRYFSRITTEIKKKYIEANDLVSPLLYHRG